MGMAVVALGCVRDPGVSGTLATLSERHKINKSTSLGEITS